MDEPQTRMKDVEVVALIIEKYHPRMSPIQAIVEANAIVSELARTRSVEPPREMIERAKKFLLRPFDSHEEDAEALAAEFTAIRTQAIEECAGVAAKWKSSLRPGTEARRLGHEEAAREIAAAIHICAVDTTRPTY